MVIDAARLRCALALVVVALMVVDAERDPRGLYRLTPRQPLPPGEYAFVLTHGRGSVSQVYDFGVD